MLLLTILSAVLGGLAVVGVSVLWLGARRLSQREATTAELARRHRGEIGQYDQANEAVKLLAGLAALYFLGLWVTIITLQTGGGPWLSLGGILITQLTLSAWITMLMAGLSRRGLSLAFLAGLGPPRQIVFWRHRKASALVTQAISLFEVGR